MELITKLSGLLKAITYTIHVMFRRNFKTISPEEFINGNESVNGNEIVTIVLSQREYPVLGD
jgi:hypothetical protein